MHVDGYLGYTILHFWKIKYVKAYLSKVFMEFIKYYVNIFTLSYNRFKKNTVAFAENVNIKSF